jgi:hypothetical protein
VSEALSSNPSTIKKKERKRAMRWRKMLYPLNFIS